jgi:hypothetical protein
LGGDAYNGTDSLFFAPRHGGINSENGGRYAFAPGPDSGNENPQINPGFEGAAPVGEEFHTVAIYNYDQRVASIWINGNNIGDAAVLADRPLSELEDVNNWLGRSQWGGDAFSTANYNEFRIYEGALTPLEIAVNADAGPDTIIDDVNAYLGPLESVSLELDTTDLSTGAVPASVELTGDYQNIKGISITSLAGVEIASSDPSVAELLEGPARVLALKEGSSVITATYEGKESSVTVNVRETGTVAVLKHRYTFDGNADDSVGGKNGVLHGSGSFQDGAVVLNGAGSAGDGYVDLPDFLISDFFYDEFDNPIPLDENPEVTLEVYGNWAGGAVWQRIWDFGDNSAGIEDETNDVAFNGITSWFMTPNQGGNGLRTSISSLIGDNPLLVGPGLAPGEDYYIVVALNPQSRSAKMYLNGELVSVETISDDQTLGINDVNVWLGRSNWSADVNYNGSISEFRIWEGTLTTSQISQHALCGPDELDCEISVDPAELNISNNNDGTVTIGWTSSGTLQSASSVTGPYEDVAGAENPFTTNAQGNVFYRVSQ